MKEIISKTIDILCINGECYANIIEEKEEKERTWYDKFYLWYRQNFTIIILILGCLLVSSMIYYIWSKSNNKKGVQTGGEITNPVGKVAIKGAKGVGKVAIKGAKVAKVVGTGAIEGVKTVGKGAIEGAKGAKAIGTGAIKGVKAVGKGVKSKYDTYQSGTSSTSAKGFKKLRQMGDKTGITKDGLGKKVSAIKGSITNKGKAALSRGKAALKAAPGRIGDAISNNIQSFYTLLFSVGIILGFAFFFMPTICMLVIGLLTYQITKNQVTSMITQ